MVLCVGVCEHVVYNKHLDYDMISVGQCGFLKLTSRVVLLCNCNKSRMITTTRTISCQNKNIAVAICFKFCSFTHSTTIYPMFMKLRLNSRDMPEINRLRIAFVHCAWRKISTKKWDNNVFYRECTDAPVNAINWVWVSAFDQFNMQK